MSEYERQVEEALARKSRESVESRKKIQSEAQLINSLDRAFSEGGVKNKKPAAAGPAAGTAETAGTADKALEKQLAEVSGRKEEIRMLNRELEKELARSKQKEVSGEKSENVLDKGLKDAGSRLKDEQAQPRQAAEKESWLDLDKAGAAAAPSEKASAEILRYRSSDEHTQSSSGGVRTVVLAVLLAILLAAAGISGGLYYALFTYKPMEDAVNSSACAAALENDFLAAMNSGSGADDGFVFTKDMLVGGQAIRDIKSSLEAAYSGGSFTPDCGKMSERIAAGAAGSGDADALAAKAAEYYSGMIGAAPEATWFGQTGSLRLIFLVVLTAGLLGAFVLILFLMRQRRGGSAAGFAFAGAALLLEVLAIVVMATGTFRRYSAAYSYIAVLSTKYMMGGIVACMVVGAFYMLMAVEAVLFSSKRA